MNATNRAYGHALILALYVGIAPRLPPIWGLLQHAWMADSPVLQGERHSRRWPMLVFSSRNRDALRADPEARGIDVRAIGDPFLYLDRLLRVSEHGVAHRRGGGGVLAYPGHEVGSDETIARHDAYAQELLESEGSDVTVCLHGADHRNERLREPYLRRGMRVITHGSGHNHEFLMRQYAELLRHDRVVSNHVATATWHAAALGCEVEVSGTPFAPTPDHARAIDRHQRERWPELYDGGLREERARQLAGRELGAEHVLDPATLAATLGWAGAPRVMTFVASPVVRARRRFNERRMDEAEAERFHAELDQRWYDSFLGDSTQ